ncbi:hypothetical protein Brsp05_02723 [Brucella sp. NBRC 12953]|uniref:hypothetical protein n=1 Tax=Brucella sp. NBRC 12953 TaxID=3075481 RepID=UPI000DE44F20
MAVLPDYMSGTITVTQGDVNFTGTNTLWRTMGFREGDTVQLQGFTAIIKGTSEFGNPIDSNVAGQFVEPWPGQSGTFAYRMRFLPDGARLAGKSTNLIELLGNGVLANLAELGVEDGKVPVGNAVGQYELKPTSGFGIQDPTGSLGKLAALTLAANKILNTDASGSLTQSDITAAALAVLALTGGANKFPYFTAENAAALADLTAQARTMLASTTPAVTSLGYSPANRAGDTFSGPISTNVPASDWQFKTTFTVTLANLAGYNFETGNGMAIVSETQSFGATAIYILGGGTARLVSQTGTIFGESSNSNIFMTHIGNDVYGIGNVTGQTITLQMMNFKTRYV